jgi:hypothetical protein
MIPIRFRLLIFTPVILFTYQSVISPVLKTLPLTGNNQPVSFYLYVLESIASFHLPLRHIPHFP